MTTNPANIPGIRYEPFHPPTCKCACGCQRKSRTGLVFCSLCRRGGHRLPSATLSYMDHRNSETENRARTACTRCAKPVDNYAELQPGTGLCNNCAS